MSIRQVFLLLFVVVAAGLAGFLLAQTATTVVFGKLAGEHAAVFAKKQSAPQLKPEEVDAAAKNALAPFDRGEKGQNPYRIQHELQDTMQDLVGIVRREDEMQRALTKLGEFWERAKNAGVEGNREYNPGWHTALDLRRERLGGHFRDDFPNKAEEFGKFNIIVSKGADGEMKIDRRPIVPLRDDQKQIIEENK